MILDLPLCDSFVEPQVRQDASVGGPAASAARFGGPEFGQDIAEPTKRARLAPKKPAACHPRQRRRSSEPSSRANYATGAESVTTSRVVLYRY